MVQVAGIVQLDTYRFIGCWDPEDNDNDDDDDGNGPISLANIAVGDSFT